MTSLITTRINTFFSARLSIKQWIYLAALFLTIFVHSNLAYGQLDSIHYLPPLSTNNETEGGGTYSHQIYLSTPSTTGFDVDIKSPDGVILTTLNVSNTSPQVYTLGNSYNDVTILSLANVGIIQSDKGLVFESPGGEKFYVNYRIGGQRQSASLTTKGHKALGTRFRWGGFPNNSTNSNNAAVLGVLATENNTIITLSGYDPACAFQLGTDRDGHTADVMTMTLNAGESFVFMAGNNASTANGDGFLGASLTSTKPIAIANGHLLGSPQIGASDRDAGIDQPVAETALGKEYILIRGNGATDNRAEYGIVIATQDNTDIFVNGNTTPIATINSGENYVVLGSNYVDDVMYINTSENIYMYQVLSGANRAQTYGLNYIPPVNCLSPTFLDNISDVHLISNGNGGNTTYTGAVTILATAGATLTVTDGGGAVSLPAAVNVLGNTDWEAYKISGVTGDVSVSSTDPIVVGTFGRNSQAGFAGYFSGFDNLPIVGPAAGYDPCLSASTDVRLTTGSFDTYQWYKDDVLLPGETNSFIDVTLQGSYSVAITLGGCPYTSAKHPVFYCGSELVLTKTVDNDNPYEGDIITFTLDAHSLGQVALTNVVIDEALPAGLTLVSATPNFGTYTAPNWTVGAMGSGQKVTMTVVASVDAGTDKTYITNMIANTQDQVDNNFLTDDPLETIFVGDPDFDLDGIPDVLDWDDDNDGILDTEENVCTAPVNTTASNPALWWGIIWFYYTKQ